ncbi:hypothetical protein [Aquabacterium sp.]|uniref:hypothetical protein n=1 Tax=Aquabacterium sp. TaxID=1872578 RepID=UPI002B9D3652|nr:hypothetical protein [Aquabacterium sp.]HSW07971.1 hypothetical protein [Aquabacterium sp.]
MDCGDEAALARRAQRLRHHGVAAQEAGAALCHSRRVERLFIAHDPAGTAIELFSGLAEADQPLASPVFPGGFRTGALGMGHAALVARDLAAMERFYGATPSGFDFEIGHGSQEIDPAGWRELPSSVTSSWGHQPSARLQWKMAKALLNQWVRGA